MKRVSLVFSTVLVIVAVLTAYVSWTMAEIHVPGEYATIQGAIDAAANGEIIKVQPGIYYENIDFRQKAITLTGTDWEKEDGVRAHIIDGGKVGRVVTFKSGEGPDTVLRGFTLLNGRSDYGGGIGCYQSSPTITHCIIENNESYSNGSDSNSGYGGGMYCLQDSSPKIITCWFFNNSSAAGGGGIGCNLNSEPLIEGCRLKDNSANSGGGMYCLNDSSPIITKCLIELNYAAEYAGGIACNEFSSPAIVNCVIKSNTAYIAGGGIACAASSSPSILYCAIVGNRGITEGYGGIGHFLNQNCSPVITNSIIWYNKKGSEENESPENIGGDSFTVSYSDIELKQGMLYPGEGNINEDPKFDLIKLDGHLLESSPCIDAGKCLDGIDYDMFGNPRPRDGDRDGTAKCDMGVHEHRTVCPPRLPEYITTHFTATGGDGKIWPERIKGYPDPLDDPFREEGYFNPYYGKDADLRWMNCDKKGHTFDDTIKPSYNNYFNQNTCYNAVKIRYDKYGNIINDRDVDGIPNEIEDFEQEIFSALGIHCDILNYNPNVQVESYLFENHPNIQIVNNVIYGSSLFTVFFPPYWTQNKSYPVLLKGLGGGWDLNAMYVEKVTWDIVGQFGHALSFGDGVIMVKSNCGGREAVGFNENAIDDVGSFLTKIMSDYGADLSRVVTNGGSRGGMTALVWGVNPHRYDYNVLAIEAGVPALKLGRLFSAAIFPASAGGEKFGCPGAWKPDYYDIDLNKILTPEEKLRAALRILTGMESLEEAAQKYPYGYFADPNLTEILRQKKISIPYGTHDSFMPMPALLDFDYLLKEKEIPHKIIIGYCFSHGTANDDGFTQTLKSLVKGENITPYTEDQRLICMPEELMNVNGGTKKIGVIWINANTINRIKSTKGYENYFNPDHEANNLAFSITIPHKIVNNTTLHEIEERGKEYGIITLMGEQGKSWEIRCRKEDGYSHVLHLSGIFGETMDDPHEFAYGKEYVILKWTPDTLDKFEPGERYEWFFTYDGKEIPNRFTPFVDPNGVPVKAVTVVIDEIIPPWQYYHPYRENIRDCVNFGVDQYHPLLLKENNHPVLEPIDDISILHGNTIKLTLVATDPDGDELVYDIQTVDGGLLYSTGFSFNGLSGKLTWETSEHDVGIHYLKAIAKDGKGGVDEKQFKIVIESICAGGTTKYYHDADRDGFGINGDYQCLQAPEGNYTAFAGGDFNDEDPYVYPRTFQIASLKACPGQKQVTVPIEVKDVLGLGGVDFSLQYDPTLFIAQEVRPTSLVEGFLTQSKIDQSAGKVNVVVAHSSGITEAKGTLVEIVFDVAESAKRGTVAPLIFENLRAYNENAESCGAIPIHGEIRIEDWPCGDLNKDGAINSADAILVLQIAVGLRTPDEYQLWAGDVNNDELIDSADAILILKAAVGMETRFSVNSRSRSEGPADDSSDFSKFKVDQNQMSRYRSYHSLFKAEENGRTISVSSGIEGKPGEQVIIPIEVDDASGIAGLDLELGFNPAVVKPVEAKLTSLTEGFLLMMRDTAEGRLMVSLAKAEGITGGNGALVNLVFEVLPNARESDSSRLLIQSVRLYDENAEPIKVITSNGQLSVQGEGTCPSSMVISDPVELYIPYNHYWMGLLYYPFGTW